MKNIAIFLSTLLTISAPLALAETPAPAQPHVAAAVHASDPATTAAVKELLDSMKYRELLQASFAQMLTTMPTFMKQAATAAINADPKLSAEKKKQAMDKVERELPKAVESLRATLQDPKLIDELIAEMPPLYARYFTVQEIHQLADFYKTPVGAKMLSTMPQIMNESMQISQRVMMPRMQAMIQKLAEVK